jgi:hypothetical protein
VDNIFKINGSKPTKISSQKFKLYHKIHQTKPSNRIKIQIRDSKKQIQLRKFLKNEQQLMHKEKEWIKETNLRTRTETVKMMNRDYA